ncbi:MAG: ABC transporter permease [Acetobacteraceae bacterium]|nr:ABC transporter permease [Acetobacteraceae bacterium]
MSAAATPAAAALPAWLRALVPLVLALGIGALILAALGRDPVQFFANVLNRAVFNRSGLQETLVLMAPLLLIAASLIVCFRAGLWNLGIDGQFLLAATFASAFAAAWVAALPYWVAMALLFLLAAAVGAGWAMLPAFLKARYGVNEIVSTLMMNFLGFGLSAFLIKTLFGDPEHPAPQTTMLEVAERLPRIGETLVHVGVVFALLVILAVHVVMTRTGFGLRLRIVGHNPRAAEHAGLNVRRLTFAVFAISAALAGLAGAVEVLGVRGVVRADWHPGYGLLVVPLVFLARFHGVAAIAFVFVFAVLSIGGESAARRADLPNDFLLIMMALILVILAVTDHVASRARG